ncbi:DNA repair protein [Cryphonectria parasitica EP155]|uniref:DNA repair protein REV1 n=1 Tax=Cryphonectria parasitica (strain ATCC 38755 / EP155) TaxID=660469 RepID=A0A9P5CTC7_CRYP1|nr:DNA repair protein [Cryphonectria parasitica EP155]KAF3769025.1 DNA repair protein [Cryphonectria parasitica EP155]
MGSRLDKNSSAVRKRIEGHTFSDEGGEEYEASSFGGFGDYMRRKKIKLQNLDAELRDASGKPQIFKGIVAHVSGYTQPPLHILHRDLVAHGAGFLQYLDGKTSATHIIASSLTPKKAVEFKDYRIVKPAWVVDSIAAGRILPWSDYRVLDEGPRQKLISFDGGKLSSQANTPQRGYNDQIQKGYYASQFRNSASSATRLDSRSPSSASQNPTSSKFTPSKLRPAENPDIPPDNVGKGMPGNTHEKPMTSEEHNAWLLSDPRLRKSSTANPGFLQQYYDQSRLHHLSTWKAELKSRMQRLANEKSAGSRKAIKRRPGARRYIMHVDFDSFFCAVSLKNAPEYIDKPAVVAHSTGTGSEIASCNYPARKFGVKNGMWMKRALELCADLKVLPYDFPAYEEASRLFYEAILEVGGIVQSVSIDEALIDITSLVLSASGSDGHGVSEGSIWREQEIANNIATDLRARIKDKTGCNVSVGIGGNILLAKVALRRAKPAGQYHIMQEEVLDFLGGLKVEDLPGVAYSIGGKLEEVGIRLVKDIREASKERLVSLLGPKTGEKLWEYSRGIDRAEVGDQPVRKSVSAEINWGIRFINQPEAEEFVMNLCKELERRLLNEGVKGTHLTMKIMRRSLDAPLDPPKHLGHGKCDTFNKSAVFGVATHNAVTIGKEAVSILRSFRFSPGDLRGLGVQLQKLEPIKASAAPDGSQKRLTFGAFVAASVNPATKKAEACPTKGIDEISEFDPSDDPIAEDPVTPQKPKHPAVHPALALARANEADEKASTPLNMMGTQFIMPTNPDAAVIADLPQDIRSRLMAQSKPRGSGAGLSRDQSPAGMDDEIPSDIDPEVFSALPKDVQMEVLASYGERRGQPNPAQPQTPQADGTGARQQIRKSPAQQRGRGGIRGMLSRTRERQHDATAGRVQTNFVTMNNNRRAAMETVVDEIIEELDPAFLAELPEEVRRDIVADHRRQKLAQQAGLGLSLPGPARRSAAGRARELTSGGQTKINFPKQPAKVPFAATSLSSVQEVKDMLSAWHRETKDEGPHHADVQVLETYLARVVTEERDMEKARKLVRWLDWIIEEEDDEEGAAAPSRGRQRWREALAGIKSSVQGALCERGLGPMTF